MEEADIPNGCQIVVNPAEEPSDGDAVLVCYGEQENVAVKWIYSDRRTGSIEIRSASLRFPANTFSAEDIKAGLFRVVGKVMTTLGKPKKGI